MTTHTCEFCGKTEQTKDVGQRENTWEAMPPGWLNRFEHQCDYSTVRTEVCSTDCAKGLDAREAEKERAERAEREAEWEALRPEEKERQLRFFVPVFYGETLTPATFHGMEPRYTERIADRIMNPPVTVQVSTEDEAKRRFMGLPVPDFTAPPPTTFSGLVPRIKMRVYVDGSGHPAGLVYSCPRCGGIHPIEASQLPLHQETKPLPPCPKVKP